MLSDPEMITASELTEWANSREEWRKRRLGLTKPEPKLIDWECDSVLRTNRPLLWREVRLSRST